MGAFFGSETNCPGGYPRCVCYGTHGTLACGPFVASTAGYTDFIAWVSGGTVLGDVYSGCQNVMVLWVLLLLVLLRSALRGNTLHLIRDVNEVKEQEYKSIVQALEKKVRIQNRALEAHRKAQAGIEDS